MSELADAIRTALIFAVFVAVLLSAPIWGAWIDGETVQWERAEADRHWQAFNPIDGDDGNDCRRHVVDAAVSTEETGR